jgi:hypothetical protein
VQPDPPSPTTTAPSTPTTRRQQTTTIRIQNKTKDRLIRIGKKNQSYESIVSMLISEHYGKYLASSKDEEEEYEEATGGDEHT